VLRRADPDLYLLLPEFFSFYVRCCNFDVEFLIFLLCMEKGATEEGEIQLIFIVLCSAGCGGKQRGGQQQ
jgi:hypothetical protein